MDSYINEQWQLFHHLAYQHGYSNRLLFTLGACGIEFVAYYLHCCFFLCADYIGFLDNYAIRSGKHRKPSDKQQWEGFKEASFDLFIKKPIILYMVFPYVTWALDFETAPELSTAFLHWVSMEILFSITFFLAHCTLHKVTFLYKYVHKVHHTFHESVGFAAQFAHPVEAGLAAFHILFAVVIVRPHFLTFLAFLFTRLVEIVDAHCGYEVPWNCLYPWSGFYPWGCGVRMHDYHHSHNRGCYGGGVLGIWDRICGTDKDFREFESRERTEVNREKAK